MTKLEYARYVSGVKRLNAKIVQAERTFGKHSRTAAKIKNEIATLIPSEALYFNKKGIIQISRSKALYSKYGSDYISKAEKVDATREVLNTAKSTISKFPTDKLLIKQKDAIARAELLTSIDTFSEEILPLIYSIKDERGQRALDILRQKGRRSYSEMQEIVELVGG